MKRLFNITFFLFFGVCCLSFLRLENFYLELISHFVFPLFLISVLYALIYIYYRDKRLLGLALFVSCLTVYPWAHLLYPVEVIKRAEASEEISILQWNSYYKNKKVHQFVDYIQEINFPDIVVVQEATQSVVDILEPLRAHYPYVFSVPGHPIHGMILFSRIPVTESQIHNFDKFLNNSKANKYVVLSFKTNKGNTPFSLIVLHALSPTRDYHNPQKNQRRQELEEIASMVSQLPTPHKILIGDLNTTPYSAYFHKLQTNSGLKNAMQGLRIQGTWPSSAPFFLRIPIDHLLISDQICVTKQTLCPNLGSDHLPVLSHIKFLK